MEKEEKEAVEALKEWRDAKKRHQALAAPAAAADRAQAQLSKMVGVACLKLYPPGMETLDLLKVRIAVL